MRGRSFWLALALLLGGAAYSGHLALAPAREVVGATCRAAGAAPAARSFRADDRLVMTYLYYWYDPASLAEPALTLRPPVGQPFDWRDPSWHRRQLADMADVGVDVALAVYWGAGLTWSVEGLDRLVDARDSLLASGARPPALGLFFDSNLYASLLAEDPTLADLTSDIGLETFANQVASFFERVPHCHRALVDGRPLIFLWRPDTEDGGVLRFEPGTLDALYDRLEERLGVRPYVVRERTWDAYAQAEGKSLQTDDVFGWGAALSGPLFVGRTVAVGPGYDDRLLPERPGYVRDREGGDGYARDLRTAALSGTPWLLLETWNELWEATAIGETAQYGREYLELTRQYVEVFHQLAGQRARDGWVDLGKREGSYLAWLTDAPEERGTPVFAGGRVGARPHVERDGAGYFHFALPPRLLSTGSTAVSVSVEYFDEGGGTFLLEYDSDDPRAPGGGLYTPTPTVTLDGSGSWRWQTFTLPDARFRRRQYGGYGDFRIQDLPARGVPGHIFGRVIVTTEPSTRPVLLSPESLSVLHQRPGHFFELRWRGVAGAAGYLVQLVPAGTAEPTRHGYSPADRLRCGGGPAWSAEGATQAITSEDRCLVEHVPSAPPGVYRWRAWGLDASGAPIGEPSDWGLLLTGP